MVADTPKIWLSILVSLWFWLTYTDRAAFLNKINWNVKILRNFRLSSWFGLKSNSIDQGWKYFTNNLSIQNILRCPCYNLRSMLYWQENKHCSIEHYFISRKGSYQNLFVRTGSLNRNLFNKWNKYSQGASWRGFYLEWLK